MSQFAEVEWSHKIALRCANYFVGASAGAWWKHSRQTWRSRNYHLKEALRETCFIFLYTCREGNKLERFNFTFNFWPFQFEPWCGIQSCWILNLILLCFSVPGLKWKKEVSRFQDNHRMLYLRPVDLPQLSQSRSSWAAERCSPTSRFQIQCQPPRKNEDRPTHPVTSLFKFIRTCYVSAVKSTNETKEMNHEMFHLPQQKHHQSLSSSFEPWSSIIHVPSIDQNGPRKEICKCLNVHE